MNKSEIISKTEQFMRENIPSSRLTKDGSIDNYLTHVLGARDYAIKLAKIYNGDLFVVEIASLLHDVGANAGKVHASKSANIAKVFLNKFNLNVEIEEKIIKCIERHSMGSKVESIEEQIIQDADGIIFLEDTYKLYYEQRKLRYNLEKAKKISLEKVNGMINKIKTEEGIKIAKELLPKAVKYVEDN
jgi:HD superfamily phosphodiesterase